MKCYFLFFGKNKKKKYFKMSSAEFVPGMLCVNMSSGANLNEMSSHYCLQKIRNMTYL